MSKGEKKSKKRAYLSRFVIPKRTLGWAIAFLVVCIVIYAILEGMVTRDTGEIGWDWRGATKSIVVVLTSIVGTTLVTGFLIEKKSRNEIFTEALLDELAFSPENHERSRKKLLALLERDFYFAGNEKKREVYQSIIKRSSTALQHIYSTDTHNVIHCTIYPDRIEKEIIREISLRSYEETWEEKGFKLAEQVVKPFSGRSTLNIEEVSIDEEIKSSDDYEIVESPVSTGGLDEKNEYSIRRVYRYKKPLYLSNKKDTKIVVKCKTTVPPDDFMYCVRMQRPCKSYQLEFHVKDSQGRDCCLSAHAFGFCEDAINTPNMSDPSYVSVRFRDWIFYKDGVCISFYPKKKENGDKEKG